ncbi:MAG: TetR/AcrR family transcriptional regulator [Pseudomonadales bacterium]
MVKQTSDSAEQSAALSHVTVPPGNDTKSDGDRYPLRTQRKAATRRKIVSSALRLAGREGAANVTMAKVAKEADVHVTTLFTHFSSKAELFSGISEPAIVNLKQRIEESTGKMPFFQFIREIQAEFAETMTRRGQEVVDESLYLRTQVELLPAWIDYEKTQVSLLADYIQHDFAVDDIKARLFAGMIVSANIHSFDLWLSDPTNNDLLALTRQNIEHIEKIFFNDRAATGPA